MTTYIKDSELDWPDLWNELGKQTINSLKELGYIA